MKKIIMSLSLFFSLVGYSQIAGGRYAGSDGVPLNLQFHDANGNLIPIGEHTDINGSPMLNEKSGYATIKLKNGKVISDSMINYSLFDDKLFFIRNGKYFLISYPVQDFTIQYPDSSEGKSFYHFKSGFPPIETFDSSTLYEVLFEGKSIEYLKWQHKKVRESQNYGGAIEKEYATLQGFYVYLPKENRIVSVGYKLNINEIKKMLPSYSDKIESFKAGHKSNFKKEEEYVQLFSYLESKGR